MTKPDPEVYLVPVSDDRVIAIPADPPKQGAGDLEDLVASVGPLLGAFLRQHGAAGARLYELSPESRRILAAAHSDRVGGYFRGVLRGSDGKVTHQLQLREVSPSSPPSGFEVAVAVQLASIQAQLARMERSINAVALNAERVVAFIEEQQRARLLAGLHVLNDVHARSSRLGELSDTDWQRLAGIELEIETQLRAVSQELDCRITGSIFTGNPKVDAAAADKLDADRSRQLIELHRMLIGGLGAWNELLLVRKISSDDFDIHEAELAGKRLRELAERHADLVARLEDLTAVMSKTSPRSVLGRLVTDGLVIGGRNDARDIATVQAAKAVLETAVTEGRPRPVLESSAQSLTSESPDIELSA